MDQHCPHRAWQRASFGSVLGRSIFGGCAVDAGSWRLGTGELSGLSLQVPRAPGPHGPRAPKRNIENTTTLSSLVHPPPPRAGFSLGQCRQGDSVSDLTPRHDNNPPPINQVWSVDCSISTRSRGVSRYFDPVLCRWWLQGCLGHPSRLGRHLIPDRRRRHWREFVNGGNHTKFHRK